MYYAIGSGFGLPYENFGFIHPTMRSHQTEHFLAGFNGAPVGQLKVSLNSFRFDNGPVILN